jgi:uncharacterized protein (TIGR02466 family)
MAEIMTLFVTKLWRAEIPAGAARDLNGEIVAATRAFAEEDEAGKAWCAEHSYPGYTSYGSLNDLPSRAPCFAALKKYLDNEAKAFAEALSLDLGRGRLKLDSLWVNLLEPKGFHAGHIHPHSVISGTYYADIPKGAASLKFEDPRLGLMMAAPTRREDAPVEDQTFVYVSPEPGAILMWESWLRHEVPRHSGKGARISVSFNYKWA